MEPLFTGVQLCAATGLDRRTTAKIPSDHPVLIRLNPHPEQFYLLRLLFVLIALVTARLLRVVDLAASQNKVVGIPFLEQTKGDV